MKIERSMEEREGSRSERLLFVWIKSSNIWHIYSYYPMSCPSITLAMEFKQANLMNTKRDLFSCVTNTVPSEPPRTVNAVPTGPTSLMVMWDSPATEDSLNGILQGYRIFYKPVRQDEGRCSWNHEGLRITLHCLKTSIADFIPQHVKYIQIWNKPCHQGMRDRFTWPLTAALNLNLKYLVSKESLGNIKPTMQGDNEDV